MEIAVPVLYFWRDFSVFCHLFVPQQGAPTRRRLRLVIGLSAFSALSSIRWTWLVPRLTMFKQDIHMKIPNVSPRTTGLAICFAALAAITAFAADPAPNQLTEEEKMGGWTLLFDGKTTEGWRAAGKQTFPQKGWEVEDGWLHCLGQGGGDIVSKDAFDQFELKWEWKQAKAGNSGVKYFVTEKAGSALGHEYQLIDDKEH